MKNLQNILDFKITSIILLIFIPLITITSCKEGKSEELVNSDNELKATEKYRPLFHFTPKKSWMNDPNGLVYYKENYHLFYQYYPDSTVWGPMHWGHAKSKDLLNWEHRPIALYPDSLGYIFSGSAVIDKNNTAGFGKNAMVAIFTYHDPIGEKANEIDFQTQGIAYSLDEGETWTKYDKNPVIKNPGIRDFRDPKVSWYEDKKAWQMALVAKDEVQFYESKNLKDWYKLSVFRFNDNPPLGVWECSDLFKLPVEGSTEEKWVLIISHGGDSAPNGGSGTRYFVGDYDGTTFTSPQTESLWIDYGTDNYAGVTYNNTPNGKRIFIGWMSNWDYAIKTPTENWRSAMTLPRELKLIEKDGKFLVKSELIDGFDSIFTDVSKNEIKGNIPSNFEYENLQYSHISFNAEIKESLNIEISNVKGNVYKMGYDKKSGEFFTDRSKSGKVSFDEKYASSAFQKMPIGSIQKMKIDIILDASSVEIFINDGEYVMTNQLFPEEDFTSFKILEDNSKIENFEIKTLKN